ncbi:MAG: serine/threonine protein kinase, partial [Anaerolineales bacterium]|nr:serine/threonine protein kinase [Anaerolineales bacterium]
MKTSNEPSWIGRKLGGRYEIEELIGRGGMSSVYRAVDPNLKRHVAVKIIHPHLTDNAEFIQRFEQEAAAIAQLRHHNIVQVHDFNSESSVYYMVMEYIAGETLAQKLKALKNAQMHLPAADIITIMAKVCDAVNFAHERRMIHRDIKPANVMINLLGEPILMDFGIAKIIGGQSHTATGAAMGTAPYMSPEQVRGDKSDHRSDIYSLGIMLYELLSGAPPFHGESTFQIMLRHVNEPVPDIRQLDIGTPVALITILEKALAKEPEDRFQSAKEMGTALSTAGMQLHGSVTDTLAARYLDRLAILWQQATDLFESHQFEAVIDKLDELKQIDPNFQRLKIDELRQSAIDRLYERAVMRYQAGSYEESKMLLNALEQRAPDEPDIEQLARKIQHALDNQHLLTKLESLYEEAAVFLDSRSFDQALGRW